MNRNATLPVLACLTLLLASSGALADEGLRQVWRDSDLQVVHNSWGTCVRSRWDNSPDPCAAVVAYQPPPPAPPRTVIAEADRTVFFPFNKSELTPDSQQKLDTLAHRINSASDIQSAQVVGYADRIGTTSYNEALSKKRAEGVRDYLISRNVITQPETLTRWVGKSESNTQCPGKETHDQLIQCLAPDRKATVELKYKEQLQTPEPEASAAPYMQQPLMGQPPLSPTAAAHGASYESNAVVPPAPYPTEKNNNNSAVQTYPLQQSAVEPVHVYSLPRPPASTVQSSAGTSSVAPQSQPDSSSPAATALQAAPGAGQYEQTAYQAEYPPSNHPVDQPSDPYRERYLTTGE